jgi:hypothetical protein
LIRIKRTERCDNRNQKVSQVKLGLKRPGYIKLNSLTNDLEAR